MVATVPPLADLARHLLGPEGVVVSLLPSGASPHSFTLTPAVARELADADLILRIGHHGLPFEESLLELVADPSPPMLSMVESSDASPHPWVSPLQMLDFAEPVSQALVELDPRRASVYRQNLDTFRVEVERLRQEVSERLQSTEPGSRFLVHHAAWGDFATEFELEEIAIEQDEREVTPADLARLITRLRPLEFSTLFVAPNTSDRGAQALARELQLEIEVLDPLPEDWFEGLRRAADQIARGAVAP